MTMYAYITLGVLSVYSLVSRSGAALRCMECADMPQPYDCGVSTECTTGSVCFLEQYVTSAGTLLYRQGCMASQACNTKRRRSDMTSLILSHDGRYRSTSDVTTCSECCSTDNCNNHGCQVQLPDRVSRGPFCYTCEAQAAETSCRLVTECRPDEVCFVNTHTTSHTPGYSSKCIQKSQCGGLLVTNTSGNPLIDHCPLCCDEDFCNDNCIHNQTVSTIQTNGQWSLWSPWSPCSVTCDQGFVTRVRYCDNPAPQHGGLTCQGNSSETQTCQTNNACTVVISPVDGQWSLWSFWSPCSVTCDQGSAMRIRSCDNPAPQNGGMSCQGDSSETQTCQSNNACSVDGQWSSWAPTSPCSVTCGRGSATGIRSCNNPVPSNGGKDCPGNSTSTLSCDALVTCPVAVAVTPVDGQWSLWSPWSPCSVTCDQGSATRIRSCDNPAPQHGGQSCQGNSSESQTCQTNNVCTVSHWTEWGQWSSCSHTCDYGTTERRRTCTSLTDSNACPGNAVQMEICQDLACSSLTAPTPGHWSTWSDWSDCSKTCGDHATKSRTRHCINPEGGAKCHGDDTSVTQCRHVTCHNGGCDDDYTHDHQLGCIKVVQRHIANYTDARHTCHDDHAHLLVIHSQREQNSAMSLLKHYDIIHDGIWLGLHLSHNNVWEWVMPHDEPLVNSSFSTPFSDVKHGSCAVMIEQSWLPSSCHLRHAFVCQKNAQ